jgi:hypothetical protein
MTVPGRVLTGAAGLVLLTVGLLALAAYPARDDWTWALLGRDKGFAEGLAFHYQHWSGRWAYTLAMLAGGHLGPAFVPTYPVWPLLTLGSLVLGAVAVVRRHGLAPAWGIVLAAPVVLVPGPAEALFWQSGALGYVLPLGLGALLLSRGEPVTVLHRGGLLLGGLVLGGWTETPAILLTAWAVVSLGREGPRWVLGGLLMGMTSIVLAPGNAERLAQVGGWKPLDTALLNGAATVGHLLQDLLTSPLVIAVLAVTARLAPPPRPGLALILLPLAAMAAATASCASVGFCEPRQTAALWLHLLLALVAGAWCYGSRIPAATWPVALLLALGYHAFDPPEGLALAGHFLGTALLLIVLARAGLGRTDLPWSAVLAIALVSSPAVARLVEDIPHAIPWRRALAERDAQVATAREAGHTTVTVRLLPPDLRPRNVSVGDLRTGNDWQGQAYARWMGLSSVRVEPRTSTQAEGRRAIEP